MQQSHIPKAIDSDSFLNFLSYYADQFKRSCGFGRWLKEYQDMDERGLFAPRILKQLFKQTFTDTFSLGFIRKQAVYYIGYKALDAAEVLERQRESYLYKVVTITGHQAQDEDGDELVDLEYGEAVRIRNAYNQEMEEELFKIEKQC